MGKTVMDRGSEGRNRLSLPGLKHRDVTGTHAVLAMAGGFRQGIGMLLGSPLNNGNGSRDAVVLMGGSAFIHAGERSLDERNHGEQQGDDMEQRAQQADIRIESRRRQR